MGDAGPIHDRTADAMVTHTSTLNAHLSTVNSAATKPIGTSAIGLTPTDASSRNRYTSAVA
jgi:hypothetical protein